MLAVREDERAGKKPKTQDALQETELRTIQAEQRIKEERERASKGGLPPMRLHVVHASSDSALTPNEFAGKRNTHHAPRRIFCSVCPQCAFCLAAFHCAFECTFCGLCWHGDILNCTAGGGHAITVAF